MATLRRIYGSWASIVNSKRLFSLAQARQLFDLVAHAAKSHPLARHLQITDAELATCWGLSKLTVKDM